jgi:outer membrane protein OmpA-like peptidoglycan-associated protein
LKKPRSQWNQQLVASAKKSPTGKQRQKFDRKTPTQALQFSQPITAAMPLLGSGLGGYRWQDIDPRTRGAVPLPQSGDNTGRTIGSVTFNPGSDELNAAARSALQPVAKNLQTEPAMAELRGYATADRESGDDAKRVALSRVISVRDHLIGLGVPGNQLGVKPVGLAPDGPKERVDIVKK